MIRFCFLEGELERRLVCAKMRQRPFIIQRLEKHLDKPPGVLQDTATA
jgi:hypothetical protein